MNSAPESPKPPALSAIRSFTSRNSDSTLAILMRSSVMLVNNERRAVRVTLARMSWPEPVERVAAYAREAGAELRVEEFGEGTPTAREAAQAIGCELGAIGKSLVFDCDGRYVLVLVPGDRRADPDKVARATGVARARVASVEEVEQATGFAPGAVAPFPLRRVERVLVDPLLLAHPVVWVGAGTDRHMAALAPAELVRLTRAESADLVSDAPPGTIRR